MAFSSRRFNSFISGRAEKTVREKVKTEMIFLLSWMNGSLLFWFCLCDRFEIG